MKYLLKKYLKEDQPFIIRTPLSTSGACYFEDVIDNFLIVWELGLDLNERISIFNIDDITKIEFLYVGDLKIEDNENDDEANIYF